MFNTNTMSSVLACDAALTEVNRSKSLLVARVTVLQNQIADPEMASGLEQTLQAAQANLAACDEGLLNLPPGTYRNRQQLTRHELARRVESLQQRIADQGDHLLFFKQLALREVENRILAMDEAAAAIEAHRLTLPPDAGEAAA